MSALACAVADARQQAAKRGYRLAHEPGCALRAADRPASDCTCDSLAFVIAVSFQMADEREAVLSVASFARQLNRES